MNISKIKETNTYIIIYASVMVIIVAFLLAFISSVLKPTQDANVERDKKNQILTSLNIVGLKGEAIDRQYAQTITDVQTEAGGQVYVAQVDGQTKYVLPVKGRGVIPLRSQWRRSAGLPPESAGCRTAGFPRRSAYPSSVP